MVEIRSEHADHGVRLAVHGKDSADDARVRSEAALPIAVGEHGDRVARLTGALGRRKAASENGARAEHREEIRGHAQADDLLGLAALTGDRAGTDLEQRHLFEGLTLLLPVEEIRRRRPFALDPVFQIRLPYQHQAIGVRIWQRPEHHRVDDAEDGSVRSDAQRQDQQGHDGEAGNFAQGAQRVAQVF